MPYLAMEQKTPFAPVTPAERTVLVALLVSQGADPLTAIGFVDAVQAGIEAGQPDADMYRRGLLETARTLPVVGIYGEIIKAMLEARVTADLVQEISRGHKITDDILEVLENWNPGPLNDRVVAAKIAAVITGRS